MKAKYIFTGSAETESELFRFLSLVESSDDPAPKSEFDEYMFKVMTKGRNGEGDAHPGSKAKDDTGGFFEEREDGVYLTDKAKACIRF